VDPIGRFGSASPLKTSPDEEVENQFTRLMSIIRVKPQVVTYDDRLSFLETVVQ
jgi:hypothetical protein